MEKFYLIINKGDFIHLENSIKDINYFDNLKDVDYIKNGYKKYTYDFFNFNSGKKWMKDKNKIHHYLIEMKLTNKELKINKKYLHQDL